MMPYGYFLCSIKTLTNTYIYVCLTYSVFFITYLTQIQFGGVFWSQVKVFLICLKFSLASKQFYCYQAITESAKFSGEFQVSSTYLYRVHT